MFVVGVKLGAEILFAPASGVNWQATLIAILSVAAFLTIKKINSAYIILGGAVIGYIFYLIQ